MLPGLAASARVPDPSGPGDGRHRIRPTQSVVGPWWSMRVAEERPAAIVNSGKPPGTLPVTGFPFSVVCTRPHVGTYIPETRKAGIGSVPSGLDREQWRPRPGGSGDVPSRSWIRSL